MNPINPLSLSIVIPLYNEEENVAPLLFRIHETMNHFKGKWELILVDDGSSDLTLQNLKTGATEFGPHVIVLPLSRNFGQTAALQAGLDAAQGDLVVTLDGDLQNDPADIPMLIEALFERDLDLIQGWRVDRQDHWLRSKFSRVANHLIGRVTGLRLHDYGCSLKVYRREVIEKIRLYGEMHRFIPVWLAEYTAPGRIGEIAVNHHPRHAGQSKYTLSRTFRVILDLLTAFFFLHFRAKPGHFFGAIGLFFAVAGSLMMMYLGVLKYGLGEDIGQRPLFFMGILFIVTAIQFLTTGVLAELLSRTFFQSRRQPAYSLRESVDLSQAPFVAENHHETYWRTPAAEKRVRAVNHNAAHRQAGYEV